MGRRPRPAYRPPPKGFASDTKTPHQKLSTSKGRQTTSKIPSEDEQSEDDNFFVQGSSKDSASSISEDEGSSASNDADDYRDADAPRVVQWVDDDDDPAEAEALDEDSAEHDIDDLEALQDDLSLLPLGSLRKARRTVIKHDPKEKDESTPSEDDVPPATDSLGKDKEQEWSTRRRDDIAKRAHKHAPQEVTSKRPVTRRRQVIEVPKLQIRDPRFQPLAGSGASLGLDARAYEKSYGFLADLRAAEYVELRENLKRARKRLASSPRDTYEERAAEVDRLEQALKRAESAVHKDRREKVDREALERVKREEKEKRKQGKGAWHMRNSEKNQILVKARYEALAASGGRGAVRKAIEKKQRKIGQKEKRSRPYAAGPARESEGRDRGSETRKRSQGYDYARNESSKRSRFS